jgi:protein-disulfide isomerase
MKMRSIRLRFGSVIASLATFAGVGLVAAHPLHQASQGSTNNGEIFSSLIAGQSPVAGRSDASIKVVGMIDYDCPACRKNFEQVVDKAAQAQNVAVYIEQFPLPSHPLATPAATLALNAEKSGKLLAVHKALLSGNKLNQNLLNRVSVKYHLSQKPSRETRQILSQKQKGYVALHAEFVPSFLISEAGAVKLYTWHDALAKLKSLPTVGSSSTR